MILTCKKKSLYDNTLPIFIINLNAGKSKKFGRKLVLYAAREAQESLRNGIRNGQKLDKTSNLSCIILTLLLTSSLIEFIATNCIGSDTFVKQSA